MQNPFSQPGFQVTESYVKSCVAGAAVPHTDYTAFSGEEFPGELFVVTAEKNKFTGEQQALETLMLRMLVLMISDDGDLSDSGEEGITNLTNNFCLGNWYTELEFEELPTAFFQKETDFLFGAFQEHFTGRGKKLPGEPTNGPHGFFKNHKPVAAFDKINPVADEEILKVYSLVNYNDGKYFFAISRDKYILLNWQSGGPLHLLIKPSRRNPESLLIYRDAFYEVIQRKENGE